MKYDKEFLNENMMGPNSMVVAEELTQGLPFKKGMKVLDLGCGRGLTSIFLAKEFGVEVFALDLWTPPTDNYNRFKQMSVSDLIVPLQIDALNLPFPNEYFDAVVSIDSYHYFANNDTYFVEVLKPILKKDAIVAIAFPGMKFEVEHNIPEEMKPLWNEEILTMVHSIDWWKPKFEDHLENFKISEMNCFHKAWSDWLSCGNPYALEDKDMMDTDNGRYMNLIKLSGRVK
ncbi:MAG: methyltransferase domain-containing protein [Clostridia bacterium]|nr:methyltransferase domain-containing protein [Clostridia bacterium]